MAIVARGLGRGSTATTPRTANLSFIVLFGLGQDSTAIGTGAPKWKRWKWIRRRGR